MVPQTPTKQQLTATSNFSIQAPSIEGNPIQAVGAATEVMDHRWPMEAVATSAMIGTQVLILAR